VDGLASRRGARVESGALHCGLSERGDAVPGFAAVVVRLVGRAPDSAAPESGCSAEFGPGAVDGCPAADNSAVDHVRSEAQHRDVADRAAAHSAADPVSSLAVDCRRGGYRVAYFPAYAIRG